MRLAETSGQSLLISAKMRLFMPRVARSRAAGKSRGLPKSPYIMQSNCGVDSLAATVCIPITMVESGPASGFWGAAELGKLIGEPNYRLALDIGGQAKCSLMRHRLARSKIMTDYWIERSPQIGGYPIMVPVVDLSRLAMAVGSIAHVDDFGKLHVGPQSARALPGPAAYGKGGALTPRRQNANLAGRSTATFLRRRGSGRYGARRRRRTTRSPPLVSAWTMPARGSCASQTNNMVNR
jgi:N-methylhydantoinase A/oxoprolinase/acetone carboxylase beta subunit